VARFKIEYRRKDNDALTMTLCSARDNVDDAIKETDKQFEMYRHQLVQHTRAISYVANPTRLFNLFIGACAVSLFGRR